MKKTILMVLIITLAQLPGAGGRFSQAPSGLDHQLSGAAALRFGSIAQGPIKPKSAASKLDQVKQSGLDSLEKIKSLLSSLKKPIVKAITTAENYLVKFLDQILEFIKYQSKKTNQEFKKEVQEMRQDIIRLGKLIWSKVIP